MCNHKLRVEVRLYGHWDVPLIESGQVHSLDSNKLLAQLVGILVYIYTGLLQLCFWCYGYTQASLLNSDWRAFQSIGHTFVSRACLGHGSGWVLAYWLEISSCLRGDPPSFYSLRGFGLLPGAWGTSYKGYFWLCRTRAGFDPATGPTLKTALCQICTLVGRMINTQMLPVRYRVTARSTFRLPARC